MSRSATKRTGGKRKEHELILTTNKPLRCYCKLLNEKKKKNSGEKAQDNVILTKAKDQLAAVDRWSAWGSGKDESAGQCYSYNSGGLTGCGGPRKINWLWWTGGVRGVAGRMKAQDNVILMTAKDQLAAVDW
ncbi:hypothetical protein E2C01_051085 [Portunus trituberculatus]|uniref:Uncharacterized protein n=1 Tax=Portunus trituberculatus TaxID=210409 RepID=A0A5B7GAM8_PORTR|nr:hypothetical protein [Portunus trituberculatus]